MDAFLRWAWPVALLLLLLLVTVLGGVLWARRGRRAAQAPPPLGAAAAVAEATAPVDLAAIAVQREAAIEALRQARRRAAAATARVEALRQAPPPPPAQPPAQPPAAPGLPTLRQHAPVDANLARSATPQRVPVPAASAASLPSLPATPRRALSGPSDAGPATVLVVDDSKVVRIKTSRLLEKNHYQVLLAEDGLAALQAVESQRPDLVITDVEMPGLDGFELTRRLRAHPRWASLPVIMITASDDKHRAEAAAVGVDVLLGKPYADQDLLAEVHKALAAVGTAHSAAMAGLALH